LIEYRISSKDWIKEKCIRMKISQDKDMIVNEISLVIQKIFSVKQPKDQRFKLQEDETKIIPERLMS